MRIFEWVLHRMVIWIQPHSYHSYRPWLEPQVMKISREAGGLGWFCRVQPAKAYGIAMNCPGFSNIPRLCSGLLPQRLSASADEWGALSALGGKANAHPSPRGGSSPGYWYSCKWDKPQHPPVEKCIYIYISYLKGVFNLLLIGTWSGKRMIDYQDLSTLLVPIHVTSMPFWARLLPSSDSTAQNQWYLHVVPHGVFLIFHIKEHILYHIIIYIYIIYYYSSFASIEQSVELIRGFFQVPGNLGIQTGPPWPVAIPPVGSWCQEGFRVRLKARELGDGWCYCNPETDWFMPCWSMWKRVKLPIFFGFNMMFVRNYLNEP